MSVLTQYNTDAFSIFSSYDAISAVSAPFLIANGLVLPLAAAQAQAQTQVEMGAHMGLNVSKALFRDDQRTYATGSRPGAEGGFVLNIARRCFALQPALHFSQKGFTLKDTYATTNTDTGGAPQRTTITRNETYRFNYITIPVSLAFALRHDGQGLQLFGGPYFRALLAGDFSYDNRRQTTVGATVLSTSTAKYEGDVANGEYYSNSNADRKFYSRSIDAGMQAGAGYRKNGFLLQAGYSWGLRSIGADNRASSNGQILISPGPTYYNRVFQLSLSYLAGSKS